MPDKLSDILSELKTSLLQKVGHNLSQLTLYGSYARDEASPASDVDVLVVLKEIKGEDEALVRNMFYEAMLKMDFAYFLSLYLIDEAHYRTLERHQASILKNIKQDGQVLWQTI